jgi:hypothetical protein
MVLGVSIQAEPMAEPDWLGPVRAEEGRAAVIDANSRAISEGPGISWTQQQGKAEVISGQRTTFQNVKLKQPIQGEPQYRWALPSLISRGQSIRSCPGRLPCAESPPAKNC